MSVIHEITKREPTVGEEHERRFIVDAAHVGSLTVAATRPRSLLQGYLMVDGDKYRVRATTTGTLDPATNGWAYDTEYVLARKQRRNRVTRVESEWGLTMDEFGQLWPATRNWRTSKVRHDVPSTDGQIGYVLDRFPTGLVVAEVERPDPSQLENLVLPEHFGPEITGLKGWGSSGIARRSVTPAELAKVMEIWHLDRFVRPRA